MTATVSSHHQHNHAPDKIGIFVSSLCALHCVLTPFAFSFLPLLGKFYWAHPAVHFILSTMALPVGVYAFTRGYRRHKNRLIFTSGILFLASIIVVPVAVHVFKIDWNEFVIMPIAGVGLIMSHYKNLKSCACSHNHVAN